MVLNAPNVSCVYCKGEGARVRQLRVVVDGNELPHPVKVLLHCGCLSAELDALHADLDKTGLLSSWPWDELQNYTIPKAENGPEPLKVGCPFPAVSMLTLAIPTKPQPVAEPAPAPAPAPEPKAKRKKKRG